MPSVGGPSRLSRSTDNAKVVGRQTKTSPRIGRQHEERKLLSGTDKTMAEIAAEVGFYDEAHFVKTFKRSRGVTPGEYRQRHFGTDER